MSLILAKSHAYSPSLLKAWAASGLVHAVAFGLLAASGVHLMRVEMAARSGELRLEASFSERATAETVELESSDVRLVVMPQSVQLAEQTFRFEPVEPPLPADLDHPREMTLARAEVARRTATQLAAPRLDPTPLAERPRRPAARATVTTDAQPLVASPQQAASATVAADFRNNPPPVYPTAAFAAGIEGTVLLQLAVAIDGRVTQVEVLQSSGHSILDGAAVNAVKQWRGQPARIGGKPVARWETLPVRFQLR